MKVHRLGLIGLALSLSIVAACEDKTDIIIPPPPPPALTLNLVPDHLDLFVGQTGQLVAVVSGGAEGTDRGASFTSSNASVATVDANGLVTAVGEGNAQITARANADNAVADVSTVSVTIDPADVPPTVSIKSVTQFATTVPVQINNVFGQIDITANLEAPQGAQIGEVQWLVDDTVVCRQTFSGGSADVAADAEDEAQAAVELVCSVNTAQFDENTGAVAFPNGPHQIKVRVVGSQGTVVAEAPPTPFSQLQFNNVDFIRATVSSSRGTALGANSPQSLAPVGSLWHSGDITFSLLSVIYSDPTANAIQNATVNLTSSGLGVTGQPAVCVPTNVLATDPTISSTDGGAGGVGTPQCPGGTIARTVAGAAGAPFTVTFPENANVNSNGVMGVEDIWTEAIVAVTAGGQPGPVCINPDPNFNPHVPGVCGSGIGAFNPGQAFSVPLRIDNLGPRFVQLDHIRNPGNNYFGPNAYLANHVVQRPPAACPAAAAATPWFGLRRPCVRSVDYGVGSQTTAGNLDLAFVIVASGNEGGPANDAGDLAGRETPTSNSWRLRARLSDSGGNQRTVYATTTPTTVSSTVAGGNQLWGWDETPPVQTVAAGAPADMSVNTQIPSWTVTFVDQATPPAGPSGFDVLPVWGRLQRDAATLAAPTCHELNVAFAAVNCASATGGFVAAGAIIAGPPAGALLDNPGFGGGLDGYWSWRHFAVDAAANVTAEQARLTLNDFTAPSFTGGIVVPATIAGGQAVAFSSALTDNVDLGSLDAYTGYAGTYVQFAPKSVLGTYGPDQLAGTSAGAVQTAAFVRRLEGNAAGRPDGTPVAATDINYLVRDMAGHQIRYVAAPWGVAPYTAPNDGLCPAAPVADGASTQNCSARVASIAVQVLAAVGGAFPAGSAFPSEFGFASALHGLFQLQAPSAAIICNNDARVNCAANRPFTTTLMVDVTGPAQTYQSPFVAVDFYYLNAEGLLEHFGSSTAQTVTDNSVLNVRTFTYTGSWDARGVGGVSWKVRPAGGGTAYPVVAIGRNAAGDAWVSAATNVTVEGN